MVCALIVAAIAIAIAIAYLLARGIMRSVTPVLRAARAIADEGDVDQQIEVRSRDELGVMAQAVTRLIEYLRETAGAAQRIADGDLTADVVPKSKQDRPGNAFSTM